ncbi:6-pyruvoyl trahydropterin synthase family protein [Halococcus saccharolyticus]|uniref:6-pyruvoyltetrahydropterin synthase n=1 Tax=Halococcus saccharolyticus DSM 5350 TaxID=1227455 RepID=M0MNG7_9EURY|nr:6-carboxytetrahydropterin synthase [Halococcus saccharolyticus]EMA47201.1 6-pyruvoyltetrahydropterin synthase [Halococcus saccharolyticus DSM 5350]
MYTVSVMEDFIAQHYLTVPDPGPEGEVHSHHYEAELTLSGPELDEYDYLVDIETVEEVLAVVRARYEDALLNEQSKFAGHNPSVEHFAHVVWDLAADELDTDHLSTLTVTIWEDDDTWAAYEESV